MVVEASFSGGCSVGCLVAGTCQQWRVSGRAVEGWGAVVGASFSGGCLVAGFGGCGVERWRTPPMVWYGAAVAAAAHP